MSAADRIHFRDSIRFRILLLAVLPATLVGLLLAGYFTYSRLKEAESNLHQLGVITVQHLAAGSEFSMLAGDVTSLERMLLDAVKRSNARENGDRFIEVYDRNRTVVARAGARPEGLAPISLDVRFQEAEDTVLFTEPIWLVTTEIDDFPGESAASGNLRQVLGWVVLGMSKDALKAARNATVLAGLLITLLGLGLAYVLALLIGRNLLRPLQALSQMMAALAGGKMDARVEESANGELRRLQADVNSMAEALQRSQVGLEARIREATADLAAQKDEAERANAAKSRFLAATSHDLRQPLHALGLFAVTLKERLHDPEQVRLVTRIEDSINALEGMFGTLLDVSRLEAGVLAVQERPTPLQPLLDRLHQEWIGPAQEKGLSLRVAPSRLAVHADPVLLTRVLNNLVSNALRYTEQGGVVIGCRRHGQQVLLQVWDSGVGIAPEQVGRVFEEFFQVGNPERNRTKGLGLGLYIVDRICRLFGAAPQVRSRLGHGSVFTVALSRAETPVAVAPAKLAAPDAFRSEWVLILDDDRDVLEAMQMLLESWGLGVQLAANLAEAREHLHAYGRPSLILSDFRLGGHVDGDAAIAELRQLCDRPIPAALISGDTTPEGVARMQQSGLPALHKPLRPAKLRALLTHLLANPG